MAEQEPGIQVIIGYGQEGPTVFTVGEDVVGHVVAGDMPVVASILESIVDALKAEIRDGLH